jgi:hypothetical protein
MHFHSFFAESKYHLRPLAQALASGSTTLAGAFGPTALILILGAGTGAHIDRRSIKVARWFEARHRQLRSCPQSCLAARSWLSRRWVDRNVQSGSEADVKLASV